VTHTKWISRLYCFPSWFFFLSGPIDLYMNLCASLTFFACARSRECRICNDCLCIKFFREQFRNNSTTGFLAHRYNWFSVSQLKLLSVSVFYLTLCYQFHLQVLFFGSFVYFVKNMAQSFENLCLRNLNAGRRKDGMES
jgi:hypothetical protein